jgi:hypothetical protein
MKIPTPNLTMRIFRKTISINLIVVVFCLSLPFWA